MPGEDYPVAVRQLAVELWCENGKPGLGNRKALLAKFRKKFKEEWPDEKMPTNPSQFVNWWILAWQQRGSVLTAPPTPRRSVVTDADVDHCYDALLNGYTNSRGHFFFRSWRQAAKKSGTIRQVLESTASEDGVQLTPTSLWRRIKERHPNLSRRLLRFHHQRNEAERQERVAYCTNLLAMGEAALKRYLARVVWLDSKKLYVVPRAHWVYAPKDADLCVETTRVPTSWRKAKKINYYCAVNQVLGAVTFLPVTGTTELAKIYKEVGWPYQPYKVMPS